MASSSTLFFQNTSTNIFLNDQKPQRIQNIFDLLQATSTQVSRAPIDTTSTLIRKKSAKKRKSITFSATQLKSISTTTSTTQHQNKRNPETTVKMTSTTVNAPVDAEDSACPYCGGSGWAGSSCTSCGAGTQKK
ncbi:hypothetical protein BDZ45DRAFT_734660 [Acephala macrosclerotiorum]|nr:hypothetical protein BDZ45DRAFT_734660 [Acephala macrosclerotiorum]